MLRSLIAACLLACLLPSVSGAAKPGFSHDIVVVNAFFDDPAMVAAVAQEREPWQVDYHKNFITIEATQQDYDALVKAGFRVEIDQRLTGQLNRSYTRLPGQNRGIAGFPCYRTVAETYADAAALAQDNPGLVSWLDIGDSWEKQNGSDGEDLRVLVLGNDAGTGDRPKLFVMTAVHARELATAELNTRFAEYLVDNYGVDADVTWLLDEHEIHLSLQSNPDGRKQAQTGLFWRKNTNQNACGTTSNSRGIDLNRNFPYQWGCCGGSSSSPCSETYRGTAAGSEPETMAIRDYVSSIFPDQRADDLVTPAPDDATGVFLDVHSYGQLVLWPWGWGPTVAPNGTALQTFGRKLSWFSDYYPEQAIGLYPTDGTTDDFAYGELGLAAYTYELGTSFFQDCSTFENTILPDNLESLLYAAKVARTPYQTPAGPDTLALNLSAGAVAPGDTVQLTAVADDTRFNNSNGTEPVQSVSAAEFYLDNPPWSGAAATALPVSAADGAFDSSSETLTASINTAGLAMGRHIIYLRSQDSAGNWGAVSAAFVYVVDPAIAPVISGTVTAAGSGQPVAASIDAGAPFVATSDVSGTYSLLLPAGEYSITATPDSPDYAPATVSGITVAEGQSIVQDFELLPYCDVFSDDAENGDQGWSAAAPWAITDEAANSPTRSWSDSPGGEYSDNINSTLTSPTIMVTDLSDLRLEFASLCRTEASYDYCIIEVSDTNGASWSEVARYDGVAADWQDQVISLSQYAGAANFQVRFRLQSDFSVTEDGWYLDDIRLRGAGSQCVLAGDTDADGVIDTLDNCLTVANSDQRDTNADGLGNMCDPDVDNSGFVDLQDLALFRASFLAAGDLDTDLNGDANTDLQDLAILRAYFLSAPGPGATQ
ncbi:MAG: hypothetical protein HKN06_06980 [Gammaproteobacteria bacterium]|nr:hypothetical protein [Gammaproteobacteria bacterium]